MTYRELKERQQSEVNTFPCFFAFSKGQFDEGMSSLGVNSNEELYRGPGGMFYRKSDSEKLRELIDRLQAEMEEAYKDDAFLFDAFYCEMADHEYCLTIDKDEVLEALGLTLEELERDHRMSDIWRKASKEYFAKQDM